MAVSARGMAITGIEDRRYWNWIPTNESRYHDVKDHSFSSVCDVVI